MLLSPNGAELVLWLHILAASVWIGGQLTIALLLPVLRPDAQLLAAASRRYQWLAWPAFAVLVLTGIANTHSAGISWSALIHSDRGRTLTFKLGFVTLSGLAAAIHAFVVAPRASRRSMPATRALSGSLGGLSLLAAVIAALYGVVIAHV